MKKSIKLTLLLIGVLFSGNSFAQLNISKTKASEEIVRVKFFGVTRIVLDRSVIESDTLYNIRYVNNAFKSKIDFKSFSIVASTEEMLLIKDIFLKAIEGEYEGENLALTFGDKKYLISKGSGGLWLYHSEYDYAIFSKKEVIKLFEPFNAK